VAAPVSARFSWGPLLRDLQRAKRRVDSLGRKVDALGHQADLETSEAEQLRLASPSRVPLRTALDAYLMVRAQLESVGRQRRRVTLARIALRSKGWVQSWWR
jgi:hypothetical protein